MASMSRRDLIVVGGGVAGLAAGCYALMNGFHARILEHGLAAGGVCTAWKRGPYTIDGCVHWLLGSGPGGPFRPIFEELGVVRDTPLRPIQHFTRYQNLEDDWSIDVTSDLDALRRALVDLAPEDKTAINQIFDGVAAMSDFVWPVSDPPETVPVVERLKQVWEMRRAAPAFVRFHGDVATFSSERIASPRLRELLEALIAPEMPLFFFLMLLSQLAAGQLSRPLGGSAALRDALVRRFTELGGELSLATTVEEVVVDQHRVAGVRLEDGRILRADLVLSTASAYETALRLLGGRFLDPATRQRLDEWPKYEAIALVSYGVERPLADAPWSLIVHQREPFVLGGRAQSQLAFRTYNDDATFAPPGHTVVQSMLETDYRFWAEQGDRYAATRDAAASALLDRLEQSVPGIRADVRVTDVATPLTFWRFARVWRGAFEGWLPTKRTYGVRVPRKVPGLQGLYLAGQWVEPGGGVPISMMSGRHAIQVLCNDLGRGFVATPAS
jgi:phytoene dehydrogenase-like protein